MKKIIVIFLFFCSVSNAQKYPYWFLNQGEYPHSVIGYSSSSFSPDSSVSYAFKDAAVNYSLLKSCNVEGDSESWATELGNYLVDKNVSVEFDTLYDYFIHNYKIVDSLFLDDFVIVLTLPKNIEKNVNRKRIDVKKRKSPAWIQGVVLKNTAIGETCDKHYFEEYAWKEATLDAVKRFAFHKTVIQTDTGRVLNGNGDFRRTAKLNCRLKNLSILHRWFDVKNRVFYVLIKENN